MTKQEKRADGSLQTRITRLGNGNYGVQIIQDGKVTWQNNDAKNRMEAGKQVKSMLRMLDKCGSNSRMASRSRDRMSRPGKRRTF